MQLVSVTKILWMCLHLLLSKSEGSDLFLPITFTPSASTSATVKTEVLTTEISSSVRSTSSEGYRTTSKALETSAWAAKTTLMTVSTDPAGHIGKKPLDIKDVKTIDTVHTLFDTKTLWLYGLIAGSLAVFVTVPVAVSCFTRRRVKARLRQGSIKLNCEDPDQESEEIEMRPVVERNFPYGRSSLSAHKHGNSDSTSDLLGKCHLSVNASANQFLLTSENHAASQTNQSLIPELNAVSSPSQPRTVILGPLSSTPDTRQTDETGENDQAEDSGLEEISIRLRQSSVLSAFHISEKDDDECMGNCNNARRNSFLFKGNSSLKIKYDNVEPFLTGVDNEKHAVITDESATRNRKSEPVYYVLEGPGEDWNNVLNEKNGSDPYQSLVPAEGNKTGQQNPRGYQDSGCGFAEELTPSEHYQALTPPMHSNILDSGSSCSPSATLHGSFPGAYQPLKLCHKPVSYSILQHERLRSVAGVYQPLRRSTRQTSLLREEEKKRCKSAPQSSLNYELSNSREPVGGQEKAEPVYHTASQGDRCPLNYDDPGTSLPQERRCTPRPNPMTQRRTSQDPTTVHMGFSQPRSRRANLNEPRYSPSPVRKEALLQKQPRPKLPRDHLRNLSETSHSLISVTRGSAPERSRPLTDPDQGILSPLPRRLGHRRNMSDGRCPIDLSTVASIRQLTSTRDSPTASLEMLVSDNHGSLCDTTHCRVDIGP